ncbi:hypothetical protein T310_9927, partial [Rasamsonia emersonii CBS 393.64]
QHNRTDEQVISNVHNAMQLLSRLGTTRATKLLDKVKEDGPTPPSLIFRSHDDLVFPLKAVSPLPHSQNTSHNDSSTVDGLCATEGGRALGNYLLFCYAGCQFLLGCLCHRLGCLYISRY